MKSITRIGLALALATAFTMAHAYPRPAGRVDYGAPGADAAFARRIEIGPDTKWINVDATETVTLVNPAGQSFAWKFDTAEGIVPLASIAPTGFLQGHAINAYVMPLPHND